MAELKNQMEELVLEAIDEYLRDRSEICDCEKCRLDMAALALNELPPRYAVTERGKVFAKISQLECQFETDILMAVIRAVEKVGNNPRHGGELGKVGRKGWVSGQKNILAFISGLKTSQLQNCGSGGPASRSLR